MKKVFFVILYFLSCAFLANAHTVVTIFPTQKEKQISPYLFGYNATTYSGNYDADSLLIAYCKVLQPTSIRYPGGDASNMYFFNGIPKDLPSEVLTGIGRWTDYLDGTLDINWRLNLKQYYSFLEKVGAHGFITINYPYARYGLGENSVTKAASLAAEWVRQDKGHTLYWEIGNETYACWEGGFKIDTFHRKQPEYINGYLYGKHFKIIADSMRIAAKRMGHEIKIGAVMTDNDHIWDGSGKNVTKSWNEQLICELRTNKNGCYADFISVHSYFLDGSERTPSQFINSSNNVKKINDFIYSFFEKNKIRPVPLALTEWNLSGNNGGHQNSQIGALHAVCVLGKMMENNYVASCRFALKDYWRGNENKGDYGIFANADPMKKTSTPYTPYYHLVLLRRTLDGTLVKTRTNQDEGLICFSALTYKRRLGVVVINSNSQMRTFELLIPRSKYKDAYIKWYELSPADGSNEWCEALKINGMTAEGIDFLKQVPAHETNWKQYCKFSINGYSVIYLTIEKTSKKTLDFNLSWQLEVLCERNNSFYQCSVLKVN